jgi:hypothetical protein
MSPRTEEVKDRSIRAPLDSTDGLIALGALVAVAGVALVSIGAALVLTGGLLIAAVVLLAS